MSRLVDLQQQFSDYLLSRGDDIAALIIEDEKLDRKTRLDIYKNAYVIRLIKCIETDHPILGKYLGDELFDTMATGYINSNPSRYTSLRNFCDSLPDYLLKTEPFASVPILAEIATFERYMLSAFDAADDQRAVITDLTSIEPEKWPTIKIFFHASVCVFTTQWNSVESWQALKNDTSPQEATDKFEQYWLIWRGPDLLTQFRSTTNEGSIMISCFQSGDNYAEVCETLLAHAPDQQVSELTIKHLIEWLNSGLIKKISVDS